MKRDLKESSDAMNVSVISFLDLPDSYRIKHFGIYEILKLGANHNFNPQKEKN